MTVRGERREIDRMLDGQPVPPPPEELRQRLLAEIPEPETVELHPDLQDRRVVPFGRRSWHLAAAAVLTVALVGAVTWQLRRGGVAVGRLESQVLGDVAAESVPRSAVSEQPVEPPATAEEAEDVGSVVREVTAEIDAVDRNEKSSTSAPREPVYLKSETGPTRGTAAGEQSRLRSRIPTAPSNQEAPAPAATPSTVELSPDAARRLLEGRVVVDEETARKAGAPLARIVVEQPAPGGEADLAANGRRPDPTRDAVVTFIPAQALPAPPSTGGTAEPNDAPYGDVFFRSYGTNPFVDTEEDPLSTFGLEVDTGSYNVVRRYLADGHLPPPDAVRVEELVNALDYGDVGPVEGDVRLVAEGAPSPYAAGETYRVLRVGVRFRDVVDAERPPARLVFVVDTSGSMAREDRLKTVKRALASLLANLRPDDQVGLVEYGSRGRVVLEPTGDHERVLRAVERLAPNGSTNAEEGLVLGYRMADESFVPNGINRVILCSDGVANVGATGPESILERIRAEAGRGVELTTVGFGMGNYNDVLMERLADAGDGRYAYVDTFAEARRLFVEELTGTLLTVGHDAKAQVELDPAVVTRWRLLGYENRDIADDRFRDPTVDAGEIGAGQAAVAVYEVKLADRVSDRDPVATLRVRYRPRGSDREVELEETLHVRDLARSWDRAPWSLRLAASTAELGEMLKGTYWARGGSWDLLVRELDRLAEERFADPRVSQLAVLAETARDLATPRADEIHQRDRVVDEER